MKVDLNLFNGVSSRAMPLYRFIVQELLESPFESDREFLKENDLILKHMIETYCEELHDLLWNDEIEHYSFRTEKIEYELKTAYWEAFGENDPNKMPATVDEVLTDPRSLENDEIYTWLLFYDSAGAPVYVKLGVLVRKAWERCQAEPERIVEFDKDEEKKRNYTVYYDNLIEHLRKKFCVIHFRDMLFIFNGKKFVEDNGIVRKEGEAILKRDGLTEKKGIRSVMENVMYSVKNRSTIPTKFFPFNKLGSRMIPCRNGVLWREGPYHLLPHSPLFAYTYSINADYDKEAKCERINEFIKSLVAPENVPILYEIPALALLQNPWFQKAYMLVGEGSNGKSTYLKLIEEFLGKENVSHIPLQSLCRPTFERAEIAGKLANLYADIPEKAIKYTGEFKTLTGGDTTSAQKKFRDPFEFTNKAILVFSANVTPEINDDTYAFWRRWILVKFPYTFKEDPEFFDNLIDEKELSGFLNEVLKAMLRIETERRVTKTKDVEEMMIEWRRRSNSIYAFVTDRCERDPQSVITKDELYRRYVEYCKAENLPAKSKDRFGKDLPRFAPYAVSDRQRIAGEVKRVWVGIRVRELNNEENELQKVSGFWGTCSYCGEYGFIEFKDKEGNYLCKNCAELEGGEKE